MCQICMALCLFKLPHNTDFKLWSAQILLKMCLFGTSFMTSSSLVYTYGFQKFVSKYEISILDCVYPPNKFACNLMRF